MLVNGNLLATDNLTLTGSDLVNHLRIVNHVLMTYTFFQMRWISQTTINGWQWWDQWLLCAHSMKDDWDKEPSPPPTFYCYPSSDRSDKWAAGPCSSSFPAVHRCRTSCAEEVTYCAAQPIRAHITHHSWEPHRHCDKWLQRKETCVSVCVYLCVWVCFPYIISKSYGPITTASGSFQTERVVIANNLDLISLLLRHNKE